MSDQTVTVKIVADVAKATKGFVEVSKKATAMSADVTSKMADMSLSVAGMTLKVGGLVGAIGGAVTAFVSFQKAVENVDKVMGASGWAKTLGMSTQKFLEMSAVARQFNIDSDRLGDAMKDLNERIADAALDGTATYEEALNKLGLKSKELIAMPVDKQFEKVTEALSQLNTQAEKNFVAAELMADAGFEVIKMADAGATMLRDMAMEVEQLGISIDDVEVTKIENANAQFSKLSSILDGAVQKALAKIAPYFTGISKVIIDMIKKAGGIPAIFEWVKTKVKGAMEIVVSVFGSVVNAFKTVKAGLSVLSVAWLKAYKTMVEMTSWAAEKVLQGLNNIIEGYNKYAKKVNVATGKITDFFGITKNAAKEARNMGDSIKFTFDAVDIGKEKIAALNEEIKQSQQVMIENVTAMNDFAEAQASGDMPAFLKALFGEETAALIEEKAEVIKEKIAEENEKAVETAQEQADKLDKVDEEAKERLKARTSKYLREMQKQEKTARDQNVELWNSGYKGRIELAQGFFGHMAVLMETENRKQFEIGKAAAIAEAVINTYKSANAAYASMAGIPFVGPALGAVAAGAAVAAGVANVQKIKSQKMGGGGGGSAAGSAASTGGSASSSPSLGGGAGGGAPIGEGGESRQVTQFNIGLSGETYGQQQVRGLIGAINEQTDDNVQLKVNE